MFLDIYKYWKYIHVKSYLQWEINSEFNSKKKYNICNETAEKITACISQRVAIAQHGKEIITGATRDETY